MTNLLILGKINYFFVEAVEAVVEAELTAVSLRSIAG